MNRRELEALLSKLNIRPEAYSLAGSLKEGAMVLDEVYGKWKVFFTERGVAVDERIFDSESEACECLFELLKDDPSIRRDYK